MKEKTATKKHLLKILRENKKLFVTFLVTILFIFTTLSIPSIDYKLGNIFFGQVPRLYNLTLAQLFFTHASYPPLGKPYPYAHHQLSRTYFISGNLNIALSEAKKELEMYPENTATYYILGLTYGFMNMEEEAIDAFSQFIQYNPDSWAAKNDKAWLQFRIGDIDGSLKTMKSAVLSHGDNPWVLNTYGTLLINKKRYREAGVILEKALAYAKMMTEEEWGNAYPGNDPRIYKVGLQAMISSIQGNLAIVKNTHLK